MNGGFSRNMNVTIQLGGYLNKWTVSSGLVRINDVLNVGERGRGLRGIQVVGGDGRTRCFGLDF